MVQSPGEKPPSRIAKLLAVMKQLRERKAAVTAAELARIVGVSERTIYRYMSELIAQGIPIHGEPGFGYILRPGLFLPPMMLTEDEAEAVRLGLKLAALRTKGAFADAVQRTLVKIGGVLSTSTRDVFHYPAIVIDEEDEAYRADFEPYLQAIRSQSRLTVELAGDPDCVRTLVCPVALRVSQHRSDLLAWNETDQAFHSFDLSSIAYVGDVGSRFGQNRRRLLEIWESQRRLDSLGRT